MHRATPLFTTAAFLSLGAAVFAAKGDAVSDPKNADADFAVQGEYVGQVQQDGAKQTLGVQVVAAGKGQFDAVVYLGGLPGDGWDEKTRQTAKGKTEGKQTILQGKQRTLRISDGVVTVLNSGGDVVGKLERVARQSETLGAKPPKGAVVLFDGKSAERFQGGKMTEDGLLIQGVTSKDKFQSGTLHVEFRLPYMPEARGQGRGNSGCYLQGRYEVQMLDSFGLEGKDNECGGVYGIAPPRINMCYPPLTWQTYDIDFTAAQYQDGKKVKNARMTVRHNGVVVHKDVELPQGTRAAPVKESAEPGPVYLQNHGNPVRYRNIWFVEKES